MFDLNDEVFKNMPNDVRNMLADQNLIDALGDLNERKDEEIDKLEAENRELKEELEWYREKLIEIDPDFAEMVSGSDRGNEMRYDYD